MLTQRGANSALDPRAVTDAMLDAAAVLYLSGYSVMDCSDPAALRELIGRARARGVEVAVDPASAGGITDVGADRMLGDLHGCSILLPNRDEGSALTGLDDPVEMAGMLCGLFPVVALTDGPRGAIVVQNRSEPVRIPAADVGTVDPTGAGDAFAAGFLQAWIGNPDAAAAATAGVEVAALAVQSMGGRPPRRRAKVPRPVIRSAL
jgi:sugar/nucleoside kinase (ribokinase family)